MHKASKFHICTHTYVCVCLSNQNKTINIVESGKQDEEGEHLSQKVKKLVLLTNNLEKIQLSY